MRGLVGLVLGGMKAAHCIDVQRLMHSTRIIAFIVDSKVLMDLSLLFTRLCSEYIFSIPAMILIGCRFCCRSTSSSHYDVVFVILSSIEIVIVLEARLSL